MTRKIQELSPKEVLALAIHVEQANGRRLTHFADAFDGYDNEVAAKFRELAEEERQHEVWLTHKFQRRFKGPIPDVREFDVEEVIEAVEWDDSEHQIFDSLNADEVFKLALAAEDQAQAFYKKAATIKGDKSLILLFRQLSEMEKDHAGWLKKRIQDPDYKNKKIKKGKKS
jgi:rubrerythrin